jgi:transcriptional regulator with XRE-family HTH domain
MNFEGKEVNKMTTINTIATGANIKAMMKARQMTTADIQKACGFGTPQAIFKWFRGDTMPTIDNMVILAEMFDVTVDEIIAVDMIDVKCG